MLSLWLSGALAGTAYVGAGQTVGDALSEPAITEIVLQEGYDPSLEDYGGSDGLLVYDSVTIRSEQPTEPQTLPRLSLAASGLVTIQDAVVDGRLNDGQLFVQFGEVELKDVEFQGDDYPSGITAYGGKLTIKQCLFQSYSSVPAVKLDALDSYADDLEVTVEGSDFDNLSSGGIYATSAFSRSKGARLTVSDSNFTITSSNNGGAIRVDVWDELVVDGGTFSYNQATSYGGAIYLYDTEARISGTDFGTSLAASSEGGHLYLRRETLDEMVVQVEGSSFDGGDTLIGGGSIKSWGADLRLNLCTFSSAASSRGGAINIQEGRATITNSQFISNAVDQQGGAIALEGADELLVANTRFCNNQLTSADWGLGSVLDATNADRVHFENNVFEIDSAANGWALAVTGTGVVEIYDNTVVQEESQRGWLTCDACVADVVNNLFAHHAYPVLDGLPTVTGSHNLWWDVDTPGSDFPKGSAVLDDPQFEDDYDPTVCALPYLKSSSPALGAGNRPARPGGLDIGADLSLWGQDWEFDNTVDPGDSGTPGDSGLSGDSGSSSDSGVARDTGVTAGERVSWVSGGCRGGVAGAVVLALALFVRRRR